MILAVLTDGPQHGYAIAQEIVTRTRGQVTIRPGDLYRVLYRMDSAGLIESVPASGRQRDGGSQRRADYRITPFGRRVARSQATLLHEICASLLPRRTVTSEG
jgi:DNA-binding PadR family transcriptional regulator